MPEIKNITPSEETVILNVEFGRVTNRVKLDQDTDSIDTKIDRDMLHVGIDLFDAKELKACQNFQANLKSRIKAYCVPSFLRGGMYMVKLEAVDIVDKMLYEAKEPFQKLVEAFADVVDQRRDESKDRLGPAFDPGLYPNREQVLSAYRISWQWFTMGTPDSLKKISVEFFNREKEKAESAFKAATEGITQLLAAEAKKLGDHLVERLTPDEDGKPKQIRKSAIDNINEFLSTFQLRNIGTSDELNAQVARIQDLVKGLDAKNLKLNESLRDDVAKGFSEVSSALDKLVVLKPKRYLAREEEE